MKYTIQNIVFWSFSIKKAPSSPLAIVLQITVIIIVATGTYSISNYYFILMSSIKLNVSDALELLKSKEFRRRIPEIRKFISLFTHNSVVLIHIDTQHRNRI